MYFDPASARWKEGPDPAFMSKPTTPPKEPTSSGGGAVQPPQTENKPAGTSAVDAAFKQLQPGTNVIKWERDVLNPALRSAGPGVYITPRGEYQVIESGEVKRLTNIGSTNSQTIKVAPDAAQSLMEESGKHTLTWAENDIQAQTSKTVSEFQQKNPQTQLQNLELVKTAQGYNYSFSYNSPIVKSWYEPIYNEQGLMGSKWVGVSETGQRAEQFIPKDIVSSTITQKYSSFGNILSSDMKPQANMSPSHQQILAQSIFRPGMQTEPMVSPITTQTQENVIKGFETASPAEQQAGLFALGLVKYNPLISIPFTIISVPAIIKGIKSSVSEGYAFAQKVGSEGERKGLLPKEIGTALETPFGVIGAIGANFLVKPLVEEAKFIKENPVYGVGAVVSTIIFSGLVTKTASSIKENYQYYTMGERAALISDLSPSDFSWQEKISMGKTIESNMQTFLMERQQLYKVGSAYIATHPELTTIFATQNLPQSLHSDVLMVNENSAYGTAKNLIAVQGSTVQTFEYGPTLFEGGTVEFRVTSNYIIDYYTVREEFSAQKLPPTDNKIIGVSGEGKITGASNWLKEKTYESKFIGVSKELFKSDQSSGGIYLGKTAIREEGSLLVDISQEKGEYTSYIIGEQNKGSMRLPDMQKAKVFIDVEGGKINFIKQFGVVDNKIGTFYQGVETVWQGRSRGEGFTYIPRSDQPIKPFTFLGSQTVENTAGANLVKQTARETASAINIPKSTVVELFAAEKPSTISSSIGGAAVDIGVEGAYPAGPQYPYSKSDIFSKAFPKKNYPGESSESYNYEFRIKAPGEPSAQGMGEELQQNQGNKLSFDQKVNLNQGSASRSTIKQESESRSVELPNLLPGMESVLEQHQEKFVYQHQGVAQISGQTQMQGQMQGQLTDQRTEQATITPTITTPIAGTAQHWQPDNFKLTLPKNRDFPIESARKPTFNFWGKSSLKQPSKQKYKSLPSSDLFNIAESERKFGSVHFAAGPKAEKEFARRVGSFGVFARFPTFEQIKGKFRL
jgi:hypothetical protein